jgi:hypothetical protein
MPKVLYDGKPPFLRLFELFGFSLSMTGSVEAHAEECPFCGKGKFYLNTETGEYKCHSENSCGAKGNAYTFIRWVHRTCLEGTTDDGYRQLKDNRGLPLQTLKRHELAWNGVNGCWLIPFKSEKGEVQNLTRFYMDSGKKLALPGLPLRLFGLDKLSPEPSSARTLFICEGPWDAIALDQHLVSNKTRTRYDILAVPSATVFNKDWLKYLKGYKAVRLCLDNDKAGREGQERIAKLARDEKVDCKLFALAWPDGYPEKCDIRDLVKDGVNVAEFTREHCRKVTAGERRILFVQGDAIPEEKVEWMWEGHVPFRQFVSLSGLMGTQKSAIARDLAARATAGLPMPNCRQAVAPFCVLYFTSEDSQSRVRDLVRVHGGDLAKLQVHDIASGDEPIDLLEYLGEIEAEINSRQARLVILDALNSFVGGDISTDSKARRTLSGRLQALARRTGACVIGIRNWGRMEGGTASQKALGATSLSDVARCVMNTRELPVTDKQPWPYQLEFEKVSDAPKPKAILYKVKNLSTCEADSHLRKIVWLDLVGLEEAVKRGAFKRVAEKGSSSSTTLSASGASHPAFSGEKVAKKGSGSNATQ